MPISGLGSWLPTIDEFLTHWQQVNDDDPLNPLVLSGTYDRADLVTDRAALAANFADVQAKENLRQTAAGDRDVKRSVIRPKMLQFGPAVRGYLPGSRYLPSIPRTPSFRDSPGIWRNRMDDTSSLWTTINANSPAVPGFAPPLVLAGGYPVATFNTDAAALSTAFAAVETTDQNAQLAREQRNQTFEPIYNWLKQYRLVVVARYPAGHPLVDSLPKLTPAPGSTPDPVQLSGSWNAGTSMADLVWSASADPELDFYSIRYHPGPRYKASEEQTVDSVVPPTTNFSTNFGLPASGSVAWFKVYVVTTTSNEKGSNAVKIVRP